jgi:hypothetical protein
MNLTITIMIVIMIVIMMIIIIQELKMKHTMNKMIHGQLCKNVVMVHPMVIYLISIIILHLWTFKTPIF